MSATSPPILIVEDNPTARKMFRVALEAEGHRVLEAGDGRSALAQLAREVPALVLQDLVVPDYDGLELARAMRAVPGCADLPIVVMSGFPRLLDLALGEPGCFNASLVKPIVPSQLIEVVRQYTAAPAITSETFGRGKKILIVDDDHVQLKLAGLRFADVGFEVELATDRATAIELATTNPPDVIVCDVLMPGTDGYELCVEIRELPQLRTTPFILVSAHYGGAEDEQLARTAGANALVTRSPTLVETLDAVRTCLRAEQGVPAKDPEFDRAHDARVIAHLKRQASAAAGLAERAALQTAQLSVLAALTDALSRSGDLEDALGDVLAGSLNAAGITCGALYRIDAHGRTALSFACGFATSAMTELSELFGWSRLLETDDPAVVVPREILPSDEADAFHQRLDANVAVIVPIMDGNYRIGSLVLGTSLPDITEQDLTTFGRAIGSHIAQALALTAAFNRLEHSAEASRLLAASLDIETIQDTVGRLATTHLAQICEIQISGELPVVHVAPTCPGEVVVDEAYLARLRELPSTRTLVVPLVAGENHLGTVTFARVGAARDFRPADVVAMEDLTRRAAMALGNARLYESARAANRAKDEFLAIVSHELRSPLSAILGWAQMLGRGLPPAKHIKAVESIQRNAHAQAALIDDLLDMSRIVSGTLSLEVKPLQLGLLVEAAIESLRPQLEAKQLELRIVRGTGFHRVIGDPGRLQQIVFNLLGNAIKFTPSNGHIQITLAQHGADVTLTIEDDGKGIDPDFLEHVFERFRQADGSSSRECGGLGLGLAITRHLVELHGGTILAESDGPGLGATFTVTLPHAPEDRTASQVVGQGLAGTSRVLDGVSILVVDDEIDTLEVTAMQLELFGASTRTARGVAEALKAIATTVPDVLLSDLGMPGEDGYSLISKVRRLPQCSGLPAIAVSGFAGDEVRRKAIAAGFHAHLAKPVQLDDLLTTLASVGAIALTR